MPGFKSSDGKKPGIEIWRVEKMEVNNWPKDQYGKFYTGDAYIVLKTVDKPTGREQDLFFWLGKECSQDEQGVAAYKTVELDDMLGGEPVQHREVQGHESKAFLAVFKNGISYLEGGIESGFNKVKRDEYKPRLLHIKGKRNVRVAQVPLACSSLNEGDVFVLDNGLTLYQWNGKKANKYEKVKGCEIITQIKNDERGGRAATIFMDQGNNDNDATFWKLLGGQGKIQTEEEAGTDAAVKAPEPTLYQISDASGSLKMTQVAKGKLTRDMLKTEDAFLVDSGDAVSVWIGKGASKDEKKKGMQYGMDFLKDNNRPAHTPISRVIEGGEPPLFKQCFSVWNPPRVAKVGEPKEKKADDTAALYAKKVQQAEERMAPTDGSVEVWRMKDMKKEVVEKSLYGQFHAGDSYLILYTYMNGDKKAWIIYFWQGRDSSTDEKAAVAQYAKQMDDDLGGDPVQVRVVQGKEPSHFLTLFQGKMIVHEGGYASGFKNSTEQDSMDTDGVSLFHVKGTTALNTRAVQVAEVAGSLNSGDAFVLLTPKTMFVWYGKGCNASEQKAALSVAQILKGGRKVSEIKEGSEPEEFWSSIGGKGEYASGPVLEEGAREPRLFQCTNTYGNFSIEEIVDFTQDDLIPDDIMILDTFESVFVWVGAESNREERDKALETALTYVEKCNDGRSKDTPVFRVCPGAEPPQFTCQFLGWDRQKASQEFQDPYMKALAAQTAGGLVAASRDDVGYKKFEGANISLEDLQKNRVDNIDPAKKEMYLSDDEFQKLFGMDKAAFGKLAAWKQKAAKQKHALF